MKKMLIRKIPFVIAIAVLGMAAFTGLVMLLWNATLPAVLHTGTISFWQAAGLLLLSKILFSGFRGRRRMSGGCHKKMVFGKWQDMTDEEKELYTNKNRSYTRYETVNC